MRGWGAVAGCIPKMVGAASVLVLSACGRIGYDPIVSERPQPLCDWREGTPRFATPVRLPDPIDLDTSIESDPFVDGEGSLWFSSDRSGSVDLWMARANGDGTFTEPTPVSDLDLGPDAVDRGLYVFEDRLAVHSGARAGESEQLFVSERGDDGAWSPGIAMVPGPASIRRHLDPILGLDPVSRRLHLVFTGERSSGEIVLHAGTRSADAPFAPEFEAVDRVALGGDGADSQPSLDVSLSILVFTSTRGGRTALWYATREDPDHAFGAATEIPDLVPGDDRDSFLESDGCTLWLVGGEGDLYRADVIP